MACPRCYVTAVLVDAEGHASIVPGEKLHPSEIADSGDVELRHARRSTGTFLADDLPPPGYERPRICGLCSGVYYPRIPTEGAPP